MSSPSSVDQITCRRYSSARQPPPLPPKRVSSLMPDSPYNASEDPFGIYEQPRFTAAKLPTVSANKRTARPSSEMFYEQPTEISTFKRYSQQLPSTSEDPYSLNAQPGSIAADLPTFSANRRKARPSSEMFYEQPTEIRTFKRYSQQLPSTSEDPYSPDAQPGSIAAELSTFSANRRKARPSSEMFYVSPSEIKTSNRYSQPVPAPRSSLLKTAQQPATSESSDIYANMSAGVKSFHMPPKPRRPRRAATEKEPPSTLTFTDLESFDFHPVIDSPKKSSAFFLASRHKHSSRHSRRISDKDFDSTFDTSDLNDETLNEVNTAGSEPLPPNPPSPFVPRRPESFMDKTSGSNLTLNPFAKPGPVDPYVGSSVVVGLTNSNFKPFLTDVDAALVLFYDPWNKNCKWAKINMREAANITQRRNHVFAAVDCTIESQLCKRQKISVFPTMKLFAQGKTVSTYLDDSFLSSQQMADFVEKTPSVSKQLPSAKECVIQ